MQTVFATGKSQTKTAVRERSRQQVVAGSPSSPNPAAAVSKNTGREVCKVIWFLSSSFLFFKIIFFYIFKVLHTLLLMSALFIVRCARPSVRIFSMSPSRLFLVGTPSHACRYTHVHSRDMRKFACNNVDYCLMSVVIFYTIG